MAGLARKILCSRSTIGLLPYSFFLSLLDNFAFHYFNSFSPCLDHQKKGIGPCPRGIIVGKHKIPWPTYVLNTKYYNSVIYDEKDIEKCVSFQSLQLMLKFSILESFHGNDTSSFASFFDNANPMLLVLFFRYPHLMKST